MKLWTCHAESSALASSHQMKLPIRLAVHLEHQEEHGYGIFYFFTGETVSHPFQGGSSMPAEIVFFYPIGSIKPSTFYLGAERS